jgi:hypothetical protein
MTHRRCFNLRVIATVTMLTSFGGAMAQCTKDTDCKGDRICERGTCVSPAQGVVPAPPLPDRATSASAAAQQVRQPPPPDAAHVAKISAQAESGAVTFRIGDVFTGPGPLTVGWLGSKKQILVPAGPWVVLAAVDERFGWARMTHVALGQIEAKEIRSLLLFYLNSRPVPASTTWPAATACELGPSAAVFHWASSAARDRQCVAGSAMSFVSPEKWTGEPWMTIRANLVRMEISSRPSDILRTDFVFTGDLGHFLGVSRFDTGALGWATESRDQTIGGRRLWAQAYARLAAKGYRRELQVEDLRSGDVAIPSGMTLPD